ANFAFVLRANNLPSAPKKAMARDYSWAIFSDEAGNADLGGRLSTRALGRNVACDAAKHPFGFLALVESHETALGDFTLCRQVRQQAAHLAQRHADRLSPFGVEPLTVLF